MSAAACWEDANPKLPAEILQFLGESKDPDLADLELLIAVPEWEVDLPGGKRPSQTDVLALARNAKNLVVLGVEAKVDQPFGLPSPRRRLTLLLVRSSASLTLRRS